MRQFGRNFGKMYINLYVSWTKIYGPNYLLLSIVQNSFVWINIHANQIPILENNALPQ